MATASGALRTIVYTKQDTGFPSTYVNTGGKQMRNTGDSLNLSKTTMTSEELTGDARVTFLRHGNESIGGDISFEFAYEDFDDFLAAALRGKWEDDVLKQGTNGGVGNPPKLDYFSFEKGFPDITGSNHLLFRDCVINTLSLSMGLDSVVTGSIGFVGGTNAGFKAQQLTSPSSPEYNEPFVTFGGEFKVGGTSVCATITGLDFTIDNGVTANHTLCSPSAKSMTGDKINITGTITALFNDVTEVERFFKEDTFAVMAKIEMSPDSGNTTGNSVQFDFPAVKYTGADIPTSGGGVISLSLPFQALYDTDSASALVITRAAGAI